MSSILLLSIRPEYAHKIFDSNKTVELRRVRPRLLNEGDLVLIYISSPTKAVFGSFKVDTIIEKPIAELWEEVEDKAGISSENFYDYYQGTKTGIGIFLKDIHRFSQPVDLHRLRKKLPELKPPQSYRYITDKQLRIVYSLGECSR
ncbi:MULTISPECIES: ASCH domain-containing protein [unclassified Microcoleus]|uniref:ASCH domain-containing protein n=1 Tax=unclassified Microcoleus TaxID=2642155 RepID=UPI002FCFB673